MVANNSFDWFLLGPVFIALTLFLFARTVWKNDIKNGFEMRRKCRRYGWAEVLGYQHDSEREIHGLELTGRRIHQWQFDLCIVDDLGRAHQVHTGWISRNLGDLGRRFRVRYNPDDISEFIVTGDDAISVAAIVIFAILTGVGLLLLGGVVYLVLI